MVIGEMLGVPAEDRETMRHWFDELLHREDDSATPTPKAQAALQSVIDYGMAMVADRRRTPRDDTITALVEAEVPDGDTTRRLDDLEIAIFVFPPRRRGRPRRSLGSSAAPR